MMLRVLLLFLAFALVSPSLATAEHAARPDYLHEVVIELDPDSVDPERVATWLLYQLHLPLSEVPGRITYVYRKALWGFAVQLSEREMIQAEQLLDELGGVRRAIVTTEISLNAAPSEDDRWSAVYHYQIIPTNLMRTAAPIGGDYSHVDVAVLDSGIDRSHPDLNVAGGIDCIAPRAERGTYGHDPLGHGTHVSGTIGAIDNEIGVVGFAPNAQLWDVRVATDQGLVPFGALLCGFEWLAQNRTRIEVVNMSFSGPTIAEQDNVFRQALATVSDDMVLVAAAGNSRSNAKYYSPANYPEVVTVSAYSDFDGNPGGLMSNPGTRCAGTSRDDALASFSNYGQVDLAAPGVCILSTLPDNHYGRHSGTSMASPAVAGAIARFIGDNPDQASIAVERVIEHSAWNTDLWHVGDRDSHMEPVLWLGPNGAPRLPSQPLPPPPRLN